MGLTGSDGGAGRMAGTDYDTPNACFLVTYPGAAGLKAFEKHLTPLDLPAKVLADGPGAAGGDSDFDGVCLGFFGQQQHDRGLDRGDAGHDPQRVREADAFYQGPQHPHRD